MFKTEQFSFSRARRVFQMRTWFVVFFVCFLGKLDAQGQLNQKPVALSGRVVDAGGYPLPGAIVRVIPLSKDSQAMTLSTNKEGAFAVNPLADGLYSVEASRGGFINVRYYPVSVCFPEATILEFALPVGEISEGGVQFEALISGTLETKGKPLPNVLICLTKIVSAVPNQSETCTETNELGQYALSVSPGLYMVRVMQGQKQLLNRKASFSNPVNYRNFIQLGSPIKNKHKER
jgi:hypothetical protein